MSLFKARDWWSTVAGYEEFYDVSSMCVASVDNSANKSPSLRAVSLNCGVSRLEQFHVLRRYT